MPLGAARLNFLAKKQAAAISRTQVSVTAVNAEIDTAQSKFGGSSGLFDPTSPAHYLQITDNLAAFKFGTGDFTVEGWFRFTNTNGDSAIYTGGTVNGDIDMRRTNDNLLRIGRINTAWDLTSGATGITVNTWHHIAFTRSGTTAKIFVDGTQVASGSNSINYNITTQLRIGAHTTSALGLPGHIDEFRVSNIARYTSGFTAPTSAFTNDSNTLLLLHMDGTDGSTTFTDDNGVRAQVGIQAIGNAQVDTAQSKFGGASALFDGSGDYLTSLPSSTLTQNDLTIEFWYKIPTTTTTYGLFGLNDSSNQNGFNCLSLSTNTFRIRFSVSGSSSTLFTTSTCITDDTWQHFALVRNGNTVTVYVDGNNVGSASNNTSFLNMINSLTLSDVNIGRDAISANYYSGYIDEFRISNTARYTANFTPATTAFTNDDNTLLLLHMNGTDGSTTFTDDNS